MTVKEVMERVPTTNSGYALAYINDAMKEIQTMIEDNMMAGLLNLTADQRYYGFPADLEVLRSVMVKDTENDKYIRIQRLQYVESDESDNA
jgi:hypothetical protein